MNSKHSLKDFKELVSNDLICKEQLYHESVWNDSVSIFVKLASIAGFQVDDLVELMEAKGKSQMVEIVFEKLFVYQKYASGEPIIPIRTQ